MDDSTPIPSFYTGSQATSLGSMYTGLKIHQPKPIPHPALRTVGLHSALPHSSPIRSPNTMDRNHPAVNLPVRPSDRPRVTLAADVGPYSSFPSAGSSGLCSLEEGRRQPFNLCNHHVACVLCSCYPVSSLSPLPHMPGSFPGEANVPPNHGSPLRNNRMTGRDIVISRALEYHIKKIQDAGYIVYIKPIGNGATNEEDNALEDSDAFIGSNDDDFIESENKSI
ncbi:hypothetical protein PHLCEN_2v12881 [Hermanssonia centrifuga]|uniref:Uncharacterized protein n=1 Tax=Hermanssonia centrifuga TaxID=98765 RepID=A0A2R6NFQ8_9APHY|nr:hypothetical protein PHLCEN_2v12881 [Hermanssonia centrifuga]